MKRGFQTQFEDIVMDIASGAVSWRVLYGAITPGGGKSSLALILSRLLPKFADKLLWVVPRVTLAKQAEETFLKPELARLFPHTAKIRHDTNTPNPCRSHQGYTTTYDAIRADPGLHRQEFARYRYILLLDEPHHVKTHFEQPEHPEFVTSHAIQPLIDTAALVVYASGTFERHDQKPILGLPYVETGKGYELSFPAQQTIRYRRQDALYDKAIVPLHFTVLNAQAQWRDGKGKKIERESFDETSYESGQMLNAVLETEFAQHLLHETVTQWQGHKQQYPKAKLLVVAPQITIAKRYASWLKTDHGLIARIATSDDTKDAREAIDAFKGRGAAKLDVLVTVGMAYEGLDVPEITHLACLTRYRSRPWLEQCFARACRTAPGKSFGYIFAPDDPLLSAVVKMIQDEQSAVVKDIDPNEPPQVPGGLGGTKGGDENRVIPLTSKATDVRSYDYEQSITREETARIALIMQQHGILGVSPLQMKRAFDAMDILQPPSPAPDPLPDELTPSEEEARQRTAIDAYTKSVDFAYFAGAWGSTNMDIRRHGFLPRENMSLEELLTLWQWLNERYPLGPVSSEEVI